MDTAAVEDVAESRDRADSAGSLNDVQSEGDLDIDDEDDAQDDGDDNLLNNDDESNMDLTLLTGSDVDTDVGSDFSGDVSCFDSSLKPAVTFCNSRMISRLLRGAMI